MNRERMIETFPVGTLVSPQVDESTLEVLPQYGGATHVVIGHSDHDAAGRARDMLRVFPLGLPFREGRESMMHPDRAVVREAMIA